MLGRYLLEDGSGYYLLEDSSGYYVLDGESTLPQRVPNLITDISQWVHTDPRYWGLLQGLVVAVLNADDGDICHRDRGEVADRYPPTLAGPGWVWTRSDVYRPRQDNPSGTLVSHLRVPSTPADWISIFGYMHFSAGDDFDQANFQWEGTSKDLIWNHRGVGGGYDVIESPSFPYEATWAAAWDAAGSDLYKDGEYFGTYTRQGAAWVADNRKRFLAVSDAEETAYSYLLMWNRRLTRAELDLLHKDPYAPFRYHVPLWRKAKGVLVVPLGVAGVLSSTGAALKRTDKVPAGTLSLSGATVKRADKAASGVLTTAGAATKRTDQLPAGSITPAGATAKQTSKALAGTLTLSGTLTAFRTVLLAVASVLSTSASL